MKVPGVDKAFQRHVNLSDRVDMVIKTCPNLYKLVFVDEGKIQL